MKNVTHRVNQEDQNMLREGAIVVLDLNEDRFFNSFLVKKTNGGNRSVVNLKDQVFFLLNQMLLPGDKKCMIDLKDEIFQRKDLLYEFFLSLLRASFRYCCLFNVFKSPTLSPP